MWSELGNAPSASEIEITVMGPGFGESIVAHLGKGEWLIVDSCIDAADNARPVAPLRYLHALGVDVVKAVKFIVVSHWDDDHVKGIADVVHACPNSRFVCPHVFSDAKFTSFVEANALGSAAADGANVKNIRRVLDILKSRDQPIVRPAPGRMLHSDPMIRSWSPSDYDANEFLQYVAQMHPKAGEGLRKITPGSPNLTSVVLSIDWPSNCSVLLAADMENHANPQRGWGAIVSEAKNLGWTKGDFVKIPHHGSHTGHDGNMWDILLLPHPISVIAPFGKGQLANRPPKTTDINRIRELSGSMFITANHNSAAKPPRGWEVNRSLREGGIVMTTLKNPLGIVRHRKIQGEGWKHELFGEARRVK